MSIIDTILTDLGFRHKPVPVPPVVNPPVPVPTPAPVPVVAPVSAKLVQVVIFNKSTVLTDAQVAAWVPALQVQVSDHFAPSWGVDAVLTFAPTGSPFPAEAWQLGIFDNSDQAGALGYHDVSPNGLPLGKVFAATDKQYGANPSVTTSHELLEMLGDPEINLVAFDDQNNRLWAYEASDAVEADSLGYKIGDVVVSDFVTPYWFMPSMKGKNVAFSYRQSVTAPLTLAKGGYISYYDLTSGKGWQQLYGDKENASMAMRPHVGSRRERRRTPRDQWMVSVPTDL